MMSAATQAAQYPQIHCSIVSPFSHMRRRHYQDSSLFRHGTGPKAWQSEAPNWFASPVSDQKITVQANASYFLNFFLKIARPANPPPTSSMVAGSGTGLTAGGALFPSAFSVLYSTHSGFLE